MASVCSCVLLSSTPSVLSLCSDLGDISRLIGDIGDLKAQFEAKISAGMSANRPKVGPRSTGRQLGGGPNAAKKIRLVSARPSMNGIRASAWPPSAM